MIEEQAAMAGNMGKGQTINPFDYVVESCKRDKEDPGSPNQEIALEILRTVEMMLTVEVDNAMAYSGKDRGKIFARRRGAHEAEHPPSVENHFHTWFHIIYGGKRKENETDAEYEKRRLIKRLARNRVSELVREYQNQEVECH